MQKEIPHSNKANRKLVVAATLGAILEWAEYTFYGYLAYKISTLFFPETDPVAGLIATYGLFAAGFLMRPLGALVFGHIGDRIGRKTALLWSIFLMAIATAGIGLLPTYSQIGLWAPALLLLCRLLQGFAVSGECNGASIFLIEHDKTNRPHLAGSWAGAGAVSGMLVGGFAAAIVSLPAAPEWAWRIPFLLGFVGGIVGLYLRRNVEETPEFKQNLKAQITQHAPLTEMIKHHKLALFQVAAFSAYLGINIYICNLYLPSFLMQKGNIPADQATFLCTIGLIFTVVLYPLFGLLADKTSGKSVMKFGLYTSLVGAPLLFFAGTYDSIPLFITAQGIFALWSAAVGAPVYKFLYDLFPTSVRYSGTTVAWSISIAIFGGTAPMFAQYLVGILNWTIAPALYVSLVSAITLCALRDKTQEVIAIQPQGIMP